MMESRNFVGGEWTVPNAGQVVVKNPSNVGMDVGLIHLSNEADVVDAGFAARKALPKWAAMNPSDRAAFLWKAAQRLEQELDHVAVVASSEMGKPISEMKGEVQRGIQLLRYYAAEGVRSIGSVIPSTQSQVLQYTKRVPLGVVGLITPWNFPVAIPIWKIAPALICGNTIVWKPAEIASLTATLVAQIFADSGFPAGVVNLVIGKGSSIGNALVSKVSVDGLSFTGSTDVGLTIAAEAAKRNIKYQTEMGGKNAAVVLRDADLNVAVPAIVSGAFRSAGQKCTATSRVIVEKEIYTEFISAIRAHVEQLYVGSALDPRSYVGPVSSPDQYQKVSSFSTLALTEGNSIATSACRENPEQGYYVNPLVVDGIPQDHPLVQDEVFGPLMVVLEAYDFDEAMSLCNQTVYGLSASVFTQNLNHGLRFLDEAEAGMVRINLETAGVEYQAPFGGMKQSSSHTREQGQTALDFYSQLKTCAVYYS